MKILIADDNDQIRGFYRTSLELLGHEVSSARHGGQALSFLEHESKYGTKFDLLITDHDMPVMNGSELCKAVRRHSYLKVMPIVMISGGGNADDAEHADLFLAKPIGLQEFKDTFSELKSRGLL